MANQNVVQGYYEAQFCFSCATKSETIYSKPFTLTQESKCESTLVAKSGNGVKTVIAFEGDDEMAFSSWRRFFNSTDEQNCPVVTCDLHDADCQGILSSDSNMYIDDSIAQQEFAIYGKTNVRKGYNQKVCLSCTNGHVRKYYPGIEIQQTQ